MKLHLVAIRQGHLLESCVSWVAHRALSDGSLAIFEANMPPRRRPNTAGCTPAPP